MYSISGNAILTNIASKKENNFASEYAAKKEAMDIEYINVHYQSNALSTITNSNRESMLDDNRSILNKSIQYKNKQSELQELQLEYESETIERELNEN